MACGGDADESKQRVEDIRRDVERNIQRGATVEEMEAIYGSLRACGPEGHLTTAELVDGVLLVRGHDVPPATPVYCVIVFDNDDQQVVLVLVLDEDLRFERSVILEYYSGL
jgi:hypothetical protein